MRCDAGPIMFVLDPMCRRSQECDKMAKDAAQPPRLEELSDAEIERIGGSLFCLGGPPTVLSGRLAERASDASRRKPKASG